jgi:hypothetical protein
MGIHLVNFNRKVLVGIRFNGTAQERARESSRMGEPIVSSRLEGKKFFNATKDGATWYYSQFQHIVWDSPTSQFKLRVTLYKDNGLDTSRENGILHGTLLGDDFIAGAIVDQVGKKIILPDGRWIDGPTGDIYNVHGAVLIHRDPKKAAQHLNDEGKVC